MSYYRLGLDSPAAYPSPVATAISLARNTAADWSRIAKGRTSKQLWRAGQAWEVGGVKSSLVGFIMDSAHIILLLAGLYVMVTAIL
jgi:hypothetical protein